MEHSGNMQSKMKSTKEIHIVTKKFMSSMSGNKHKHIHGVGLLVEEKHKFFVSGCQPISTQLIKIRPKANSFYHTVA